MTISSVIKQLAMVTAGAGFIVLGTVEAAPAASVTIGTSNDQNCIPFGSCFSVNRYQQVYSSSDFSGPVPINNLTFFDTSNPGAVVDSANYSISLSTTAQPVGGLSSNLDSNVGADKTTFFNGVLGGPISGADFTISGNNFLYNPSSGNLLLDISKSGSLGNGNASFDAQGGGSVFSRIGDTFIDNTNNGLVTEFSSSPTAVAGPSVVAVAEPSVVAVPEPSSVLSTLAFGTLGASYILQRRLKK